MRSELPIGASVGDRPRALAAPILATLAASPPLRPIATEADARAIAAAASTAGIPLALVALALGQLAGKVAAGIAEPTLRAAVAFVLSVRPPRPALARCGHEERAPVRYRRLDLEPAAPPVNGRALVTGWAAVARACGVG